MTTAKMQLVQSWLTKAQHDLASARVLADHRPPLRDTAVYHCQQCAEKAVKGYLAFCDDEAERVHDVERLVRQASQYATEFGQWVDVGAQLTPYARIYRYPGYAEEPTAVQVAQAVAVADAFYNFVLAQLPVETHPPQFDAE